MKIIAEAGSNHNGSLETAIKLVDLASDGGADFVKFQFIFPENLYLPEFSFRGKKEPNPAFLQRKREVLAKSDWQAIWSHASDRGIGITASVFCSTGLDLLAELGAEFVKISSTDLVNTELIKQAASQFDQVILSTGMASLGEIEDSLRSLRRFRSDTKVSLMHCVSKYPCTLEESNVSRLLQLRSAFGLDTGYSDHTLGSESALMALALGAQFFEKHVTTDRALPGFDHLHALNKEDFSAYVSSIGAAEKAMGSSPLEDQADFQTRLRARRGVYAATDLPMGHIVSREDVLFVRPSVSSNIRLEDVLGKELSTDIPQYSPLGFANVAVGESNWRAATDYWSTEMAQKGLDPKSNNFRP